MVIQNLILLMLRTEYCVSYNTIQVNRISLRTRVLVVVDSRIRLLRIIIIYYNDDFDKKRLIGHRMNEQPTRLTIFPLISHFHECGIHLNNSSIPLDEENRN